MDKLCLLINNQGIISYVCVPLKKLVFQCKTRDELRKIWKLWYVLMFKRTRCASYVCFPWCTNLLRVTRHFNLRSDYFELDLRIWKSTCFSRSLRVKCFRLEIITILGAIFCRTCQIDTDTFSRIVTSDPQSIVGDFLKFTAQLISFTSDSYWKQNCLKWLL